MVNFATDHIFHIGKQHLRNGMPCQDYALSGVLEGAAYAAVSDGCTDLEGGGLTDIGSRLVCLSTRQAIAQAWAIRRPLPEMVKEVNLRQQVVLDSMQGALSLRRRDLMATGLYAVASGLGGFLHARGDGVLAVQLKDGTLQAVQLSWPDSKPLYPAYAGDNFQSFIHAHGGDLSAQVLSWTRYEGKVDESLTESASGTVSLEEALQGYSWVISPEELSDVRFVALFSDGAAQVDGLPWWEVVRQLMAFKSTAGEFAKRRMNRFLSEAQSLGKGPLDDIGYAVIQVTSNDGGS